ncbi:MAG: hypothetical protein MOGMAGMI_01519 [Candidatus Omnitrophica bacterium]|nr:hypothetical protein [Candidatus Omnitrophota bacterium]
MSRPRRSSSLVPLLLTAGVLACVYGAKVGGLALDQASHLYHPTREWTATPADLGFVYEDVRFRSADGTELSAWYVPAPGASRGAVLFCHGNARNISGDVDSLKLFRAMGLDTLYFDYRGYGRSEGKPDEEGTYLDARSAWAYLTEVKGHRPERILIWGRSLGAAIALDLAVERGSAGVVLEGAFSSIRSMALRLYPWAPVDLFLKYRYDNLSKIGLLRSPALIVHSREDDVVPYGEGRRLFEAAPSGRATFLEIGGPHAVPDGRPEYRDGVSAWVRSVLRE